MGNRQEFFQMFERNRVDTKQEHNSTACAVEITIEGGEVMHGRVHHSSARPLGEELNGPSHFVDFEPHGKSRTWVSKSMIQFLKVTSIPRSDQLEKVLNSPDAMNPYVVLRVRPDADRDAIKEAYHKMVRAYHPDRFCNVDLPPEMRDYATAMASRVNIAYAALTANKAKAPAAA